jgi:hypothetical protein
VKTTLKEIKIKKIKMGSSFKMQPLIKHLQYWGSFNIIGFYEGEMKKIFI